MLHRRAKARGWKPQGRHQAMWMVRIPDHEQTAWRDLRIMAKRRAKTEGRKWQWVIVRLMAFYAKYGIPAEPPN
jgi:hypothetical protein